MTWFVSLSAIHVNRPESYFNKKIIDQSNIIIIFVGKLEVSIKHHNFHKYSTEIYPHTSNVFSLNNYLMTIDYFYSLFDLANFLMPMSKCQFFALYRSTSNG